MAVCALMVSLGRQLGMDENSAREIGLAGMLHDMGKAMMPLDVLNKPAKLTDDEYTIMKTHPQHGYELLLEAGANPNAAGAGYTALHSAVLRGDQDVVEMLLGSGADLNPRLANGTFLKRGSREYAFDKFLVGATPFLLAARAGDLAVMHPDGYAEIKDRAKDIIISGGENISSLEVEETLYRHPQIMEAAVVAMPHEKRRFVEKVDFVTSPGFINGDNTRAESGLPTGGMMRVVTDLALFGFDDKTHRMKVMALHPGVTREQVQDNTGFALIFDDETGVTAPPSDQELKVLRELDPEQLYTA